MVTQGLCAWRNGSTSPITKKPGLPEDCKKKGCLGFKHAELLCKEFILAKKEKVMSDDM